MVTDSGAVKTGGSTGGSGTVCNTVMVSREMLALLCAASNWSRKPVGTSEKVTDRKFVSALMSEAALMKTRSERVCESRTVPSAFKTETTIPFAPTSTLEA